MYILFHHEQSRFDLVLFINMMHVQTYLVFGVPASRFDLVLQVKSNPARRHIFFSSK